MNQKSKEGQVKRFSVFLALPFPPDRKHGENLITALENAGFQVKCFVKDVEDWGKRKVRNPTTEALKMLDECLFLIIDASGIPQEPGFGIGIEAGYAKAKRIEIIVLSPEGKREELKITVQGIADRVVYYKNLDDLVEQLTTLPYVST